MWRRPPFCFFGQSLITQPYIHVQAQNFTGTSAATIQILPKGTDLGVVEVAEPLECVLASEDPVDMEVDTQVSNKSEQQLTADEQSVICLLYTSPSPRD